MDKSIIYQYATKTVEYFQKHEYDELASACNIVYNYYVHNPQELLTEEYPYLIGLVFYYSTYFEEADKDIAETKVENALYLFWKSINLTDTGSESISAAARCFIMLAVQRRFAKSIFSHEHVYDADTALIYAMSYLLSFCINKDIQDFIDPNETQIFNQCMQEFSKFRFNNDPTETGRRIFISGIDNIKREIRKYAIAKLF